MKDPADLDVISSTTETNEEPVVTTSVRAGPLFRSTTAVQAIVEEAFDVHATRLKAFARAALRGDEDAAEDLVQETFLSFIRAVQGGEVPDNVGGWLHRVCANLVVSRGRRRRVAERMKRFLVDRSTVATPEEHAVLSDETSRMRVALGELPADARVALLMAADGFSAIEIGAAIGRTPNATSTYICRSRVRLRERLASERGRAR